VITFISQKCSLVIKIVDLLFWSMVLFIVTIVFASVTESMSLLYMCPITSTVVCEYIRNASLCCLLIYDDLSKHAVAYRHLSLALLKPVGREAYPSDVFYLHSRILERSCGLNLCYGLGAIACLPIIETLGNDLSAYVATNVISITDGQLYLDTILFGHGVFPAVSFWKVCF